MNVPSSSSSSQAGAGRLPKLLLALGFVGLVYALHFSSVPRFFLYEDDYFHVGVPAAEGFPWIWEQIRFVWQTWPQGRPALFSELLLEGGLISLTHSVSAAYLPALLILAANGYLTFCLFRLRFPLVPALAGAVIMVTSCADPHKILLTHSPMQWGITLNLLALILYANKRYVPAYLIAGFSLLHYEISFGLFAAAEIYCQLNRRLNLKRLGAAFAAWMGVVVLVFSVRLALGENRAVTAASDLAELLRRIATNVFLGPVYGLENSYLHPVQSLLRHPDYWALVIGLLLVGTVSLAIGWYSRREPPAPREEKEGGHALAPWLVLATLTAGPYLLQVKRTVFAGMLRPVSGYHLCLGLALGFAATLLLTLLEAHPRGRRAGYALLMTLAVASTYQNLLVQADYERSARYQAHFWSQVRQLAPDAEPGDVILVPRKQLLESEYVVSNSWGVTHGWFVLFHQTGPLKDWFNVPSARPVTVFLVPENWEQSVAVDDSGWFVHLDDYLPPGFQVGKIPLADGRFMVMDANFSGSFTRRTESLHLGDRQISPKRLTGSTPPIKQTRTGRCLWENFIN